MARHGMEKLSWLPIQIPFLYLTPDLDILYESFNLIFKLPHSRLLESEADTIGLHLMAAAGFDASHTPEFFRILNSDPKYLEWTSTHPVGETRAAEVKSLLDSDPDAYLSKSVRVLDNMDSYVWPDLKKYYLIQQMRKAVQEAQQNTQANLS